MLTREIIIFDFETNGFNLTSVLSLSAIKAKITPEGLIEKERFNRFYFRTPGEALNPNAIEINKLSESAIAHFRSSVDYPEHYIDDVHSFIEFCGDADHFVAHNFSFDKDFVGFETLISFCTFMEAQKINTGKNNKLSDLAEFYKIPVNPDNLHSSMYDVEVLFEVLKAMYNDKNDNLFKFLDERPLNKKEQKYIQVRFNSYLRSKRELKEWALKNRKDDSKHFFNIASTIEALTLPKGDVSLNQFLNIANKELAPFGIETIKVLNFCNFLKSFKILDCIKTEVSTNDTSIEYGLYSIKRTSLTGDEYNIILCNNLGKKTIKTYLTKMVNEN